MGTFLILNILFQISAACASIGRVYTQHRVIGRRWNAAALLFIALDYSLYYRYLQNGIYMTGALVFWSLTLRTAIILALNLEGEDYWRRLARGLIAATAWLACSVIIILNRCQTSGCDPKIFAVLANLSVTSVDLRGIWYLAKYFVDPTVIALTGLGLGCLGEAMGDMVRTRRCIFGMGVLMAGFAIATQNWGQLFKNLVSDIAMTVISAIEFRDRPWAEWFPHAIEKMSTTVRRFRFRYLMMRPGFRTGIDAP
jgi:hypothetical protein